jgi:hypothetical protein
VARGSHYLCYEAGIEFSVNGADTVVLVVLNRARGDWKQFAGALPNGLEWTDTKSSADRKLGQPIATHAGVNGIRAWAEYAGGSVVLTYDVTDGDAGPGAEIFDVRLK